MSKLSVNLVTWNGEMYLPYLFRSLREQTYQDWELVVIDNASTDETVSILEKELTTILVPHRLIKNLTNTGFAGGHNQGLRESHGEYALMLNQDVFLDPTCLEKLVLAMDSQAEAAAVTPRLMRWNFPDEFSNSIDSLGLKVFRNRRVVEIGAGQKWNASRWQTPPNLPLERRGSKVVEIFGVSGALPLFRRDALQQVLLPDGNVFDETYHSYKEDVDLAWRLRLAGFGSWLVPEAVAYHDRTAVGTHDLGDGAAALNKRQQSAFVQYYSYKNHLATLYKNEQWQNFILDFPWILWYEVKKFGYFLLFNRNVLKGLIELWQQRKRLRELRIKNKELRVVSWRGMRRCFKNYKL